MRKNRNHCVERGNVLFLILIAVALFAALSYAVTQSTRGGGNADTETMTMDIAPVVQSVAAMRVGIQRMVLAGVDPENLEICNSDLCFAQAGYIATLCSSGADCLWAVEGGGLSHPFVPGFRYFFYESTNNFGGPHNINNATTGDIMLAIWHDHPNGISQKMCEALNKGYGLSETIYTETDSDSTYGEGLPIEGQYDFCYDGNGEIGVSGYTSVHLLYGL